MLLPLMSTSRSIILSVLLMITKYDVTIKLKLGEGIFHAEWIACLKMFKNVESIA